MTIQFFKKFSLKTSFSFFPFFYRSFLEEEGVGVDFSLGSLTIAVIYMTKAF